MDRVNLKGFLVDLNGTIYSGGTKLEGSLRFIENLQKNGIPYRLLTNTVSLTIEEIKDKLSSVNIEVKKDEIINPIKIADSYLKKKNIQNFYFVGDRKIEEQFEFSSKGEKDPEIVILGDIQDHCTYDELNKIYDYLISGSKLISTSYSDYYLSKEGRKIDTGAFAKLFENLTDKSALIVGKPSPLFFKIALKSMGLSNNEVIAVGDDIKTDVKGAKFLGIYSVLVKTGKYDPKETEKTDPEPDEIIERLDDLLCYL